MFSAALSLYLSIVFYTYITTGYLKTIKVIAIAIVYFERTLFHLYFCENVANLRSVINKKKICSKEIFSKINIFENFRKKNVI